MQATICSLASGSSGNSLYIGVEDTHVLIDLGVGSRALGRFLASMGVAPDSLSAVLLTHEHSDHVHGLEPFAARWPHVPILATAGTARAVARRARCCF